MKNIYLVVVLFVFVFGCKPYLSSSNLKIDNNKPAKVTIVNSNGK